MRWTDSEVSILTENYGKLDIAELSDLLAGKSKNAIFKMAGLRGLTSKRLVLPLKWTDSELEIVKEHYGKLSYSKIAEFLPGRTPVAVHNAAQYLLAITKKIINYRLDMSNNAAYFIGWVASDGNLWHGKTGYTVAVSIKTTDVAILHELQTALGIGRVVRCVRMKSIRGGPPQVSDMSTLKIHNKGLFDHLKEIGLTENKSKTLKFPCFENKSLYKDFIRGVFDGDGTIYWKTCYNKHGKDNGFWQSEFVSASLSFLNNLNNYLMSNNIIKIGRVKIKPTVNALVINREDTVTFAKWLYDDDSMKLERKYNKMQKALNGIREPKNVIE